MNDQGISLVTGANGFIGSHLVDYLIAKGRRVRALVRPRADRRWLHPEAEVVEGDVTRPLGLPSAVKGVRRVYHLAGVITTFRDRQYWEVNAEGARSLVLACRKACPDLDRFVLISSLAAGGPARNGVPVRESDPPRPVSIYGASKLAGERAVTSAAGGIPVTILRPPVVYGARDRNMLTIFLGAMSGMLPSFPREKYYSVLHVRDLVRGIVLSGNSAAAAGRTYYLAHGRAQALSHSLNLISRTIGRSPRRFPLPQGILPVLAGASDALFRSVGIPIRPLRDKVREVLPDYWIADARRAREEFGFSARVGYAEGIRELAGFYRDEEWIDRGVQLV